MTASTVAQYLAALPADRRAALSAARKAINENLPEGYEEGMQFGMIGWYVPLSIYPAGYSAFQFSAFQRFRRAHGQLSNGEGAPGQGKLRRNAGEGAAGLSRNGLRSKRPGFPRATQRRAPRSPR
jgi:hypothetical protein